MTKPFGAEQKHCGSGPTTLTDAEMALVSAGQAPTFPGQGLNTAFFEGGPGGEYNYNAPRHAYTGLLIAEAQNGVGAVTAGYVQQP